MAFDTEHESFWRPDNSAVFTAAVSDRSGPFIFRLSCEMSETVNADALNTALPRASKRFPYLFVRLRKGVFWHYFEPCSALIETERERTVPCRQEAGDESMRLCRVYARGRSIACEFHHAITDGTGGMIFLRALIIEYLTALGVPLDRERNRLLDFIDREAEPEEEEWEDSYRKHFRRDIPPPDKVPKAWLLPGARMRSDYRVTTAEMPLDDALEIARKHRVSLTEWLTAYYLAAMQETYLAEGALHSKIRMSGKRITVQVPINLRKMYPSRTMRNFFLFAAPNIDMRLGKWDFPDILERVHHQMKLGMTKMELYRQLRRNVGGELNPLGRGVFLPLKNFALRIMNRKLNLALYSGSLSNLTAVRLSDDAAAHVKRFHFFPPSNLATGANVGVLSWKDRLCVTVGSTIADNRIERAFFGFLARQGLALRVDSSGEAAHHPERRR